MSCLARGCPPPAPGTRRSHCAACHETFSGLTAFDRHQTIDDRTICHPPIHRGLTQRPDGVWRLPGERPEWPGPHSEDNENGLTGVSAPNETGEVLRGAQEAAL